MIKREQVMESAGFITAQYRKNIKTALVLGTSLGGLTKNIVNQIIIPYKVIPHFAVSSVPFHAARFVIGELYGVSVIVMDGRYHYYEGLSMPLITLPIRVLYETGVRTLVLTNAAGSLKAELKPGDLAIIQDHLNLMGDNPLRGIPGDFSSERFVDMSEPYNRQWIKKAMKVAVNTQIPLQASIYAAISGPSLPTPAEANMLRFMGADTVGMSTVPEVIIARQLGMNVLAISAITDASLPGQLNPVDKKKVAAAAQQSVDWLHKLLANLINDINDS